MWLAGWQYSCLARHRRRRRLGRLFCCFSLPVMHLRLLTSSCRCNYGGDTFLHGAESLPEWTFPIKDTSARVVFSMCHILRHCFFTSPTSRNHRPHLSVKASSVCRVPIVNRFSVFGTVKTITIMEENAA